VPNLKIEVQGKTEIEWVSVIEADVPEEVIRQTNPDALTIWVELNVDKAVIDSAKQELTNRSDLDSADFVI
jgi:hypothetical protein